MIKTRNPVASNSWKYNKRQVIPNKKSPFYKKRGDKRVSRSSDFFEDL